MEKQYDYDVVIVGAGIIGTVMAKHLASTHQSILILEAGEPVSDWQAYEQRLDTFYRAQIKVPNSAYPNNPNAPQPDELDLKNIGNEPDTQGYFVQNGPMAFASSYTRTQGGTTLHWLGTCLRMLPDDFKLRSTYGHGLDWPIGYDDLQSYYEQAEFEIGVSADVEDQAYLGIKFSPDYVYPMRKIPQSLADKFFIKHTKNLSVRYQDHSYPISVTSTPQGRNGMPNPAYQNGAGYTPVGAAGYEDLGQRCEGNHNCVPICPVQAKYSSLKTMQQLQTQSNVTLLTRAVASRLLYKHGTNLIEGVEYKRYTTPNQPEYQTHTVTGKIVIVATHAVESAKLLLASGIKSSSGLVGCHLMDHPTLITWGTTPTPVYPYRGPNATSGIESCRTGSFRHQHSAFRVDMGNDGWAWSIGDPYTQLSTWVNGSQNEAPLFGRQLRERIEHHFSRQCRFGFLIEQPAQRSNRISIDEKYKDALGNYRPVINYQYSEYEKRGFVAARHISNKIFEHSGVKDATHYDPSLANHVEIDQQAYQVVGAGHYAGTHVMGTDKTNSVVNRYQQSWDFENLYLAGCGSMPSMGTANPTLTATALAIATADYIKSKG